MRLRSCSPASGRFPGAPFNPSAAAGEAIGAPRGDRRSPTSPRRARVCRPAMPPSIAICLRCSRSAPDIVLMFGLAARTRHVRIETRARNAVSVLFPDAGGRFTEAGVIARGKPPALKRQRARLRALLACGAIGAAYPPGCRAMPAVTFAITLTGARWRRRQTASRWCSSCTFHWCAAVRERRARGRRRAAVARRLVRAGEAILIALLAAARR